MQNKAYRIAQEQRVIKKRLKLVKAKDHINLKDTDGKTNYERTLEAPNTLNKQHPFDCGQAQCNQCHGHKVHKKWSGKRKEKYKNPALEDDDEFQEV